MSRIDKVKLLLPLPITPAGDQARWAGAALQSLSLNQDQDENLRLMRCRLPLGVLPHPYYLYAQGLWPQSLSTGRSELDFIGQLLKNLNESSDPIVFFSNNHLSGLTAAARRLCLPADYLDDNAALIDLKTAFAACMIFGTLKIMPQGNVEQCARMLGFKPEADQGEIKGRIQALGFCFKSLLDHNERLMRFMMRPLKQLKDDLHKAIADQQAVVILTSDQNLNLMLPLQLNGHQLTLKKLQSDGRACIIKLDLYQAPLIAPCSILTPARQQAFGINLERTIEQLQQAKAELPPSDDDQPKTQELKLIDEIKSSRTLTADQLLQLSALLRAKVFRLARDNFPENLSPDLIKLAQTRILNQLSQEIPQYRAACRSLMHTAKPENQAQADLLQAILNYPQNLA